MDILGYSLDESCPSGEGSSKGRLGKKRYGNESDDSQYKSKNLHAERRRRQKLGSRLLALRALVPKITNMNKATIIHDAIAYIQELQRSVQVLIDQLAEMETSYDQEKQSIDETDAVEDMNKPVIKAHVEVTQIHENKIWVKIISEKKRGGFTKLIEMMSALGFELTFTSAITSRGAVVVTSCLEMEGSCGKMPTIQQTRQLILDIIDVN